MKLLIAFIFLTTILSAQVSTSNWWQKELTNVNSDNKEQVIITPQAIFTDNWHNLPQTQFWKQIITLPPDSCLINVASDRKVLLKMSLTDWHKQTEIQKQHFKDSLKNIYGLSITEKINITSGKNDFYKIKEVSPSIAEGIQEFNKHGVDPWYAQAILLIESPAQLKKSISGAYGAFQLMPTVARAYGLTVNSQTDERANFKKSAYGAAQLIQRACIPEAKHILNRHGIIYNESDLWFRLFVMHIYHAGAGNVSAVMNKIQPKIGGQQLIQQLWTTSAGSFGNNSQNYTQVALATQIVLHELLEVSIKN